MRKFNTYEATNRFLSINYTSDDLRIRSNSVMVKFCPKCNRLWKLNIKPSIAAFRCPACGFSGSIVSLHAILNNISEIEALNILKDEKCKTIKITWRQNANNLASELDRTVFYSNMLASGRLLSKHEENLLKRGMKDKNVMKFYISCKSLVGKDIHKFSDKEGYINIINNIYKGKISIPGIKSSISDNDYELRMNVSKDGFLIPIISHDDVGNYIISCFQIRHDIGDVKYTFLSSEGDGYGISVTDCNKVSYSFNFWTNKQRFYVPEVVNITEGPLKGEIASQLSGQCFISIPGVNMVRDLKAELLFLKKHGCKKVNVCFDMDFLENQNVKNALDNLIKIIFSVGLECRQLIWDENYKGIDDYLLAHK